MVEEEERVLVDHLVVEQTHYDEELVARRNNEALSMIGMEL